MDKLACSTFRFRVKDAYPVHVFLVAWFRFKYRFKLSELLQNY